MTAVDSSAETTRLASLNEDGSRRNLHPADVKGRFARLRVYVFSLLALVLVGLPFARIGGQPAVLLDVQHRRFYLVGTAFNAQDAWLVFFLLTGLGFTLVVATTLWGRVWCGWACPQTVFIDGVYRRLERLIDGPPTERAKRDRAPWSPEKLFRRGAKHLAFLLVSVLLAHVVLGYFVPIRDLFAMVTTSPAVHPEAFVWVFSVSALAYGNFGFFREQFCVVMCPYGRLQGMLTDESSVVIGYDTKRGEPRGKLNVVGNGDCVDCRRCVVVCPTGIDIRDGQQMDCIGCTACVDACDDVMRRVGKPEGLVRHDSQEGFAGKPRRFWRPRLYAYCAAGLLGAVAATHALLQRGSFETTLFHARGVPYQVDGADVRNVLRLHVVNKNATTSRFRIEPGPGAVRVVIGQPEITLASGAMAEVPVLATLPLAESRGETPLVLRIIGPGETRVVTATFVGPSQ